MFAQPNQFSDTMIRQEKVAISGVVFYVAANCKKKLMEQVELIQSQHFGITDERLAELLLEKLKEEESDMICAKMVEEVIQKAKQLRKPD